MFLLTTTFAQQKDSSTYRLLTTVPVASQLFTTDKLQQLYVATPKNELIKYSPVGLELFRYNNNRLGNIGWIDVTNPFNILLYYPDFRTLITLDRTLSPTSEFNLHDLNIEGVQAIALSSDNHIWLYDDVSFKLKKIKKEGDVLIESDDLSLLLGKSVRPNFLMERDNQVFMNDPELGILIFDIYGKYIKMLDFKGLSTFQIVNNQLIYIKDAALHAFHLQSLLDQKISLPDAVTTQQQLNIQKNKLYLGDDNGIKIFEY